MVVGTFPFGQPVKHVTEADRRPKHVFVLGVYASAVHARWLSPDGSPLVKALGVASEPCIFWRGEGAEDILSAIDVPPEAGRLVPAERCFNGPSGRSLDKQFLEPLGLTRADAWLCDLVPYSCMNEGQAQGSRARIYAPGRQVRPPPSVDWQARPGKCTDAARREAIAEELRRSEAELFITLGDEPLEWFAAHVFRSERRVAEYGTNEFSYGRLHDIEFDSRRLRLLPLVHPRQADRLGLHNSCWHVRHASWMREEAPEVAARL